MPPPPPPSANPAPLHPSLPARPSPARPATGAVAYNGPLRPQAAAAGASAGAGGYGSTAAGAGAAARSREGTPGLSLPARPSFLPQSPASPRPSGSSAAASPRAGGGTGGATAAAPEDPYAALPPRIRPEDVRPSTQLVELGEGWTVRWRAWKAPALLPSRVFPPSPCSPSPSASTSSQTATDLLNYDPFAPPPGAVSPFPTPSTSTAKPASAPSSAGGAEPPAKKAKTTASSAPSATSQQQTQKKKSAFDELLAEEGVGPGNSPASTSSEPQQKKKGRVPKAMREAQAAAAAAAAASPALPPTSTSTLTPIPTPQPLTPSLLTPATLDVLPPVELPSPPPPPATAPEPPVAGPSAARVLKERLAPLRAQATEDPVARAVREVKKKAGDLAAAATTMADDAMHEEGEEPSPAQDRLRLFSFVGVAPVRLTASSSAGAEGKGKGKEGGNEEKGREGTAEGRTLWVFEVVRGEGGEGVAEGGEGKVLSAFDFVGLEALASGSFTHSALFPSLYPSTSSFAPPLSSSARSYPSALQLSSALLTVPSIQHPLPSQTHLQAAYGAFREAVREVVLEELVSLRPSPAPRGEKRLRMQDAVVYLPPLPPAALAAVPRPASAASLAVSCALQLPSVNRSALLLQPKIIEAPYGTLPSRGVRRGTPVVLAPGGVKARYVKSLRDIGEAMAAKLRKEWEGHLGEQEEEGWVLCALDLPSPPLAPAPPPSAKGKEKEHAAPTGDKERVEVVWPRSLIVVDGSRSPRGSSASRSRSRSRARAEATVSSSSDELSSSPNSSPEQGATSLPSHLRASFPLSPSRLPRPPFDAPLRRRLASQALSSTSRDCSVKHRRRRSGGSIAIPASAAEPMDEDDLPHNGYRDPVRRQTAQVWGWMGEEVRRREEDERERVREAEREKDKERERAEQAAGAAAEGAAGKRRVPPPPPPHAQGPAAGAPLNLRTPASLGGASGEACSPAELFPLGASTSSAPLTLPAPSADGADTDMLDLGVYPSPAEPFAPAPSGGVGSSAPNATGLSTLDAAFSAFDWGDGTFGTGTAAVPAPPNGGGAGSGGGDYDDNLLLSLTDDDFSFFDTPTATLPPVSNPFEHLAGPLPLQDPDGGELALLDAFSAAPPPVGSTSPDFAASAAFVAALDPHSATPNALGLSTSAPSLPPTSASAMDLIPFSAPPAPAEFISQLPQFSPVLLQTSTFAPTASLPFSYAPPTPHPQHSQQPITVSLAPSFHPNPLFSPTPSVASAFDLIPFAPSHALADAKYDPGHGKFGLPSPDSDGERGEGRGKEGMLQLLPAAMGRRSRLRLSNARVQGKDARKAQPKLDPPTTAVWSWFEAVCEPRVAVAERIRDARRKHGGEGAKGKEDGSARHRGWVRQRRVLAPLPPSFGAEGEGMSTAQNTADEASDAESSTGEGGSGADGEDRMSLDGAGATRGTRENDGFAVRVREALGASLLAFGAALHCVLPRVLPAEDGEKLPPPVVDGAKEITLAVVADQVMYNREFREATLAMCRLKEVSSPISVRAITLASSALSRISSSLSSPSSLFDDLDVLPSLTAQALPSFLLRTQQCVVETSPAAVNFWRPMGFEPLQGGKDVVAFALYEDDGEGMHEAVKAWLKNVGGAYQGLRLGEFSLGTLPESVSFVGVQEGLVPLATGLLTDAGGRDELKLLYATLSEHAKSTQNTVVFIVSPFFDSPLSSVSPIAGILHQIGKSRTAAVNMQPFPVPLAAVAPARPSLGNSGEVDRLVPLAFAVYDQLQVPVARLRFPAPETFPTARPASLQILGPPIRLFQAPAVVLSPSSPKPPPVQFALHWPATSLEVEHRHRLLHVCYGSKRAFPGDTSEWLAVTMIDEKGETWKNIPRFLKIPAGVVADVHRVRVVWSFAKALVDSADIEWRVVLCKLGEPTAVEAKAWDSLLKEHLAVSKRPLHVTFSCIDLDPAFAISPADPTSPRPPATSTLAEEGEPALAAPRPASLATAGGKVTLFDTAPSSFAYTPSEPVSLVSLPLLAPATTYLLHVPRTSSFTHAGPEPFRPSPSTAPSPISAYAVHFLLSHASRPSCYTGTLEALVADVRQSYTELAALGHARWGTSGRLAWHIEAALQALALAEHL
ncbi:hypothetical protein JCM10213_003726 [Rhodosporidiobolus nylandii]